MNRRLPHYMLFTRAEAEPDSTWSFTLQAADGSESISAADSEPQARGDRLELLAVVRGLEALDQPSRVTIVTSGRYVQAGLEYGLDEWRANGWHWECFGQMVPVKNADLWQRLDRALGFHAVEVRRWRVDRPHEHVAPAALAPPGSGQAGRHAAVACARLRSRMRSKRPAWRRLAYS